MIVQVPALTVIALENCEVFDFGPVAVAVMNSPAGTGVVRVTEKLALPLASVVTVTVPRNCAPSPRPLGSRVGLANNSIWKVVLAVLFNVPVTVVLLALEVAEVRTGAG